MESVQLQTKKIIGLVACELGLFAFYIMKYIIFIVLKAL